MYILHAQASMIDQHLGMLNTRVKVGSFLIRLRAMRRQSEAAAQPPQKVSGVRDQVSETGTRPRGQAEGKSGKPENCHPKKSGVSDALTRGVGRWMWKT